MVHIIWLRRALVAVTAVAMATAAAGEPPNNARGQNSYEMTQEIVRAARKHQAERAVRQRAWEAQKTEEKRRAYHATKQARRKLIKKKVDESNKRKSDKARRTQRGDDAGPPSL